MPINREVLPRFEVLWKGPGELSLIELFPGVRDGARVLSSHGRQGKKHGNSMVGALQPGSGLVTLGKSLSLSEPPGSHARRGGNRDVSARGRRENAASWWSALHCPGLSITVTLVNPHDLPAL